MLSCEFCKIFKNTFLQNAPRRQLPVTENKELKSYQEFVIFVVS